jgi:dimethylargininase
MMLVKRLGRQAVASSRCVVLSKSRNLTCTVAITRDIDDSLVKAALTLNPGSQSTIDIKLARAQHSRLNEEIKKAGVTVHNLKSDGYPDSVFIEDTAVIVGDTALITNPGADSRKGEVTAVREYLQKNFKQLKVVDLPKGTVDGGDILFTGAPSVLYV